MVFFLKISHPLRLTPNGATVSTEYRIIYLNTVPLFIDILVIIDEFVFL